MLEKFTFHLDTYELWGNHRFSWKIESTLAQADFLPNCWRQNGDQKEEVKLVSPCVYLPCTCRILTFQDWKMQICQPVGRYVRAGAELPSLILPPHKFILDCILMWILKQKSTFSCLPNYPFHSVWRGSIVNVKFPSKWAHKPASTLYFLVLQRKQNQH